MNITFYQNKIFSSNCLWMKLTHCSFILDLLIPSNWPILDFFDNFVDIFRDKFASNSLQIRFKFVSHLLLNSLFFLIYFVKFASIPFRKLLEPFNSFQICFRSALLHWKQSEILRVWFLGKAQGVMYISILSWLATELRLTIS